MNELSEDDYEDDNGDDECLETQPSHNPLPSKTVPIVSATHADGGGNFWIQSTIKLELRERGGGHVQSTMTIRR